MWQAEAQDQKFDMGCAAFFRKTQIYFGKAIMEQRFRCLYL